MLLYLVKSYATGQGEMAQITTVQYRNIHNSWDYSSQNQQTQLTSFNKLFCQK